MTVGGAGGPPRTKLSFGGGVGFREPKRNSPRRRNNPHHACSRKRKVLFSLDVIVIKMDIAETDLEKLI